VHRRIDDFLQPAPSVEVTFADPLLDRGNHPTGRGLIVGVLVHVEVLQTCLDPRASRTPITVYRPYQ